jgi:histidinol-phosphatase (PHP family)
VELAAHAVSVGLTEIGFSDHNPMPRDDFDDWRMRADQLDEYVEKVQKARRDFPQLTIKLALETDYLPGYEDWIRELARRHPWDYFIGSVHYVSEAWAIDSPQQLSLWKSRDPFETWSVYFERLMMAAESGLFEIIGHADLCKKFCFYPKEDCTPMFQKFLKAAASSGVCIELNTAGLRKDCKEIYPSESFLRIAYAEKVPITFGSDAHAPGEVGMNFEEALALARRVGYSHCCRFSQRQRSVVPI